MKLKKCINKTISFLTVICCLAGSAGLLQTQAAAEADEKVPTIVFENAPVKSEDLTVTKIVTGKNGGAVPEEIAQSEEFKDQKFWFSVKIDGQPIANQKYHVYATEVQDDGSTKVVEKYENDGDSDPRKSLKLYTTDLQGNFFLKAGWRAVFKADEIRALKNGAEYLVTEEQTVGYRQAAPATKDEDGKACAKGTMGELLTSVSFTNEYWGVMEGEDAAVEVSKTVAPMLEDSGYALPEDPDFTFQIKLNNEPWMATYQLWDMNTNTQLFYQGEGDYTSSEDGIFTLKANQKAVFVGTNVDGQRLINGMQCEVRELKPNPASDQEPDPLANWRVVGSTGLTDDMEEVAGYTTLVRKIKQTQSLTDMGFTNALSSFGVSKEVEEGYQGDPQAEFIFELIKADNSVWNDAKYYLFETGTKTLADNSLHATDQKGQFPLRFGQTAIFVGLPDGQHYTVREVGQKVVEEENPASTGAVVTPVTGKSIYAQSYPADGDGRPVAWTDVTGTLENKVFRNKPQTGLTVSKQVINKEGVADADDKTEFHFKIYKKENGEEVTQRYSYMVGDLRDNTDREGKFTLRNGETASFQNLPPGEYWIEEDVSWTPLYSPVTEATQSGTLTSGGTLHFTFQNSFTPQLVNVHIKKVDENGAVLANAKFTLAIDENENVLLKSEEGETRWITGSDGVANLGELQASTYYLREVVAPSGYSLIPDLIRITIERQKEDTGPLTQGTPTVFVSGSSKATAEVRNNEVWITIVNDELYELPNSGGMGIYWYSIGGMLLMMAASLILYRNKHRGEVLKD